MMSMPTMMPMLRPPSLLHRDDDETEERRRRTERDLAGTELSLRILHCGRSPLSSTCSPPDNLHPVYRSSNV
jgi:hypothetical protein